MSVYGLYLWDQADGAVCASIPWACSLRLRSYPRSCPDHGRSRSSCPEKEESKFLLPWLTVDKYYRTGYWSRKKINRWRQRVVKNPNRNETIRHIRTYVYVCVKSLNFGYGQTAKSRVDRERTSKTKYKFYRRLEQPFLSKLLFFITILHDYRHDIRAAAAAIVVCRSLVTLHRDHRTDPTRFIYVLLFKRAGNHGIPTICGPRRRPRWTGYRDRTKPEKLPR